MELRISVSEIQAVKWADLLPCWEAVNPPRNVLTQNPEITGLPEMADFKSFYSSDLENSNCDISMLKHIVQYEMNCSHTGLGIFKICIFFHERSYKFGALNGAFRINHAIWRALFTGQRNLLQRNVNFRFATSLPTATRQKCSWCETCLITLMASSISVWRGVVTWPFSSHEQLYVD